MQSVPANLHATHKTIVTTLTTGVMMKRMIVSVGEGWGGRGVGREKERKKEKKKER